MIGRSDKLSRRRPKCIPQVPTFEAGSHSLWKNLRRIVAARMPRMAAGDSTEAPPRTQQQSVLSYRQDVVLTARRMKATDATKDRTEDLLIATNKENGSCRWGENDASSPCCWPKQHWITSKRLRGRLFSGRYLFRRRGIVGDRIIHESAPAPWSARRDSLAAAIRFDNLLINVRSELR